MGFSGLISDTLRDLDSCIPSFLFVSKYLTDESNYIDFPNQESLIFNSKFYNFLRETESEKLTKMNLTKIYNKNI